MHYRKGDADDHIVNAFQALEKEEFRLLLEYVREWNTKQKLCHVAQFVLFRIFSILPPTEIVQVSIIYFLVIKYYNKNLFLEGKTNTSKAPRGCNPF